MSKESRRRQRAASQSGSAPKPAPSTGSSGATPATGSPAGGSVPESATSASAASAGSPPASTTPRPTSQPRDRAGRRERVRYQPKESFVQRYRALIIGGAVLLGVVLIGAFVFVSAAQPAFACSNLFDPAPTASPAAGASPQPGYVQPDMGNSHVAVGTKVTYANCPPASGKHFNATGAGPITPRVYGPNDTLIPQNWVHNLEHGALVLLYKGDSAAATPEGQTELRAFFDSFPNSPVCGFPPGTGPGPVFVRFDEMKSPMAALVWNRVLPMDTLDKDAMLSLYETFAERTNPEKLCAAPSASPSGGASESPAASGSAPASAAPSEGAPASTGPSAAPSAPVASPSAS